MILRFLACLIASALLASGTLAAERPKVTKLAEPPSAVLLVGNSFFIYNNGIHTHLGALVRTAEARPVARFGSVLVGMSGSGLDWHDVESYFKPPVYGYAIDSKNEVVFNKRAKKFDVGVLMDCSQCPIHPQLKSVFHEYAKKHSETIRKHGAQPMLFMSWAYENEPWMTAALAEAYTTAGNANDAMVIPAGLAFAKAREKRPDIKLHAEDHRHPSLAGTYLAACTIYASFFARSPEGLKYTAGLDPALAKFLQAVAWETVREYYGD